MVVYLEVVIHGLDVRVPANPMDDVPGREAHAPRLYSLKGELDEERPNVAIGVMPVLKALPLRRHFGTTFVGFLP
jgi:hypothetical protein